MIVAKFGGTSVSTKKSIENIEKILESNQDIKLVVVSALSGITQKLISLSESPEDSSEKIIQEIKSTHLKLSKELKIESFWKKEAENLFQELEKIAHFYFLISKTESPAKAQMEDHLLGFGEKLSCLLLHLYFQSKKWKNQKISSSDFIFTNETFQKADPKFDLIKNHVKKKLVPKLQKYSFSICEGFIGSTENGVPTTLGRGGSDFSAAIYAEALQAKQLQIWTDIDGIYSSDPRKIKSAKKIEQISFEEAAELANFGAKVLHPATLWPAIRAGVEVMIGNTFSPNQSGTIVKKYKTHTPIISALAKREKQSLLTIKSYRMLHTHGFLAKIFSTFEKYEMSVDLVTTSEVSVSLTIDRSFSQNEKLVDKKLKQIIDELKTLGEITIEHDLTVIAVIGSKINETSGLLSKVFHSLKDINVRMTCQGSSSHNFCFLVDQNVADEVLKKLHQVLIG